MLLQSLCLASYRIIHPLYIYTDRLMHIQYGALADKHRDNGDYRPVMSQIIHDYLFRCPSRRIAHLLQVTIYVSTLMLLLPLM
jgi:hypothetical protein